MIEMIHFGNNGVVGNGKDQRVVLHPKRSIVLIGRHYFPYPWPTASINDGNMHAHPSNIETRHCDAAPRERIVMLLE
jgi:hypothetical protein